MNDERSPRSAERVWTEESEALQAAMGGLLRVGRMWAQHGLRVAEQALNTSAETLRMSAQAMSEGARRLNEHESGPPEEKTTS